MRYRALGRTGLEVSAVSLGTVSLGMEYGIRAPGAFDPPAEDEAVRLLQSSFALGINLIDVAPAYGTGERIVGRAAGTRTDVIIATKVAAEDDVEGSLERSRQALQRDVIDIVQVHNATASSVRDGTVAEALLEARHRGRLRFLGASVYGEEDAFAVIDSGMYDVLQVACSVLDQRMLGKVLPAAHAAGVGVLLRSALLKGVLTEKALWLPEPLEPLRVAALRARDALCAGSWSALPAAALRFCLSQPDAASVLVGGRTLPEVEAAVAAEAAGPMNGVELAMCGALALTDDALLNPSRWPLP